MSLVVSRSAARRLIATKAVALRIPTPTTAAMPRGVDEDRIPSVGWVEGEYTIGVVKEVGFITGTTSSIRVASVPVADDIN